MHYYFLYLKQKCISIFQINGLDRVTTQLLHQTTESKQGNQIIFTKNLFTKSFYYLTLRCIGRRGGGVVRCCVFALQLSKQLQVTISSSIIYELFVLHSFSQSVSQSVRITLFYVRHGKGRNYSSKVRTITTERMISTCCFYYMVAQNMLRKHEVK